jgi:hypothetical protein
LPVKVGLALRTTLPVPVEVVTPVPPLNTGRAVVNVTAPDTARVPVIETLPFNVWFGAICELAMLPLIFVFATERILSFVIAVAPIELATSIPVVLAKNSVAPVLLLLNRPYYLFICYTYAALICRKSVEYWISYSNNLINLSDYLLSFVFNGHISPNLPENHY